jgi:hypothetical protein
MRLAGFLLLPMGWLLVLAAVILLNRPPVRAAFVIAGTAVELLGLVLLARSFIAPKPERH